MGYDEVNPILMAARKGNWHESAVAGEDGIQQSDGHLSESDSSRGTIWGLCNGALAAAALRISTQWFRISRMRRLGRRRALSAASRASVRPNTGCDLFAREKDSLAART